MNEQERAEEHLRTIRRLMERGTIYRAISAPTALVGGVLSLAASGIWLASTRSDYQRPSFRLLWLVVFLLTAGTNTLFIVLGAKKRHEPIFSSSMRAAFWALAPAFILAATFTLPFFKGGWDQAMDLSLSITWPTCYGLGLLATSHFAPRSLTLLGWAFFLSGIAAQLFFHLAGDLIFRLHGETRAGILFMAFTFGLFHLIYAVCVWPRKRPEPEL